MKKEGESIKTCYLGANTVMKMAVLLWQCNHLTTILVSLEQTTHTQADSIHSIAQTLRCTLWEAVTLCPTLTQATTPKVRESLCGSQTTNFSRV